MSLSHDKIKEIIKNDLIHHPEKQDNLQFCVACAAYGVDLDEIDAELNQNTSRTSCE